MFNSIEEENHHLQQRADTDAESINSFDSAPTLPPPPLSPSLHINEHEKAFDLDKDLPIFATQQTLSSTLWRNTPLTTRGLTHLTLHFLLPLLPSPLHPFFS